MEERTQKNVLTAQDARGSHSTDKIKDYMICPS